MKEVAKDRKEGDVEGDVDIGCALAIGSVKHRPAISATLTTTTTTTITTAAEQQQQAQNTRIHS